MIREKMLNPRDPPGLRGLILISFNPDTNRDVTAQWCMAQLHGQSCSSASPTFGCIPGENGHTTSRRPQGAEQAARNVLNPVAAAPSVSFPSSTLTARLCSCLQPILGCSDHVPPCGKEQKKGPEVPDYSLDF